MAVALLPSSGEDRERRPRDSRRPGPARRLTLAGDPAPSGEANPACSVLLVEDDPSMQLLVRVNLEAAGFLVTLARTGKEGVKLAERERPDVVLLDVMLPDLGGFEVAAKLGDVPVVFMSARAAEVDIEFGRQLGAIDYVTKPFDPLALADRLREDLEALRQGGREAVWELRFGTGR